MSFRSRHSPFIFERSRTQRWRLRRGNIIHLVLTQDEDYEDDEMEEKEEEENEEGEIGRRQTT